MRKARIYPSGELLCLNKTIETVHEGQDPIFFDNRASPSTKELHGRGVTGIPTATGTAKLTLKYMNT